MLNSKWVTLAGSHKLKRWDRVWKVREAAKVSDIKHSLHFSVVSGVVTNFHSRSCDTGFVFGDERLLLKQFTNSWGWLVYWFVWGYHFHYTHQMPQWFATGEKNAGILTVGSDIYVLQYIFFRKKMNSCHFVSLFLAAHLMLYMVLHFHNIYMPFLMQGQTCTRDEQQMATSQ